MGKSGRNTSTIMRRPKLPIDESQVYELAKISCTIKEIAAVLRCAPSTISHRFKDALHEGWEASKRQLRRKMYEIAMDGNVNMCIWLSKQYLGMRDRMPDEATQVQFNVYTNEVPK